MRDNFLMSKSDVISEYFMKGASSKWIFQWGIWRFPFLVKLVFSVSCFDSNFTATATQQCAENRCVTKLWSMSTINFCHNWGHVLLWQWLSECYAERVLQTVKSRIHTAGRKGVWENLVIHGSRHSTPTARGMNTSVLTHEAFNPYRRATGSSIKQCAPNTSWELLLQPRDISEVV